MIADGEDFAERREMDGASFVLPERRCVRALDDLFRCTSRVGRRASLDAVNRLSEDSC
jgi:hypothetical protein